MTPIKLYLQAKLTKKRVIYALIILLVAVSAGLFRTDALNALGFLPQQDPLSPGLTPQAPAELAGTVADLPPATGPPQQ